MKRTFLLTATQTKTGVTLSVIAATALVKATLVTTAIIAQLIQW